jgi:hypothetical protein
MRGHWQYSRQSRECMSLHVFPRGARTRRDETQGSPTLAARKTGPGNLRAGSAGV